MTTSSALHRIGILLLALAAFLLPLYLVSVKSAQNVLSKAEALRLTDSQEEQIVLYGEAASWQGPLNTPANRAMLELRSISQNEEVTSEMRISALRLERRALMKGRSWRSVLLGNATEERLHEISVLEGKLLGESPEATLREVTQINIRPGWQLASQGFFLSWITFVVIAILTGFERNGKFIVAPLLKSGGVAATCFALWAWTLTQI